MKQIVISSEAPEIKALEKAGDESAVALVSTNSIRLLCLFFFFVFCFVIN
jgi:hypothetical protein